ncbi:MAG: hypothetical protein J6S85_00065 [Methanobrevibacter sp.]|nr:hypothetical protein [Methanobrevibacter sp.]
MQTTSNYGLKVYEGADLFNPLTVENTNTESLDLILKAISDQAIGTATELTTGTVHALTRSDSDQALFRFTATSNFAAGDTFTVDTVQVTALTINGQALPDGAYLAGAEVLCALVGTRLTVYGVTGSTVADDALKLGGELPSYYGKAADVTLAQNTATAAGTLATQLDGRVTALENEKKMICTELWTNQDPTTSFIGQTITLLDDLSDYDYIEIIYNNAAVSPSYQLSSGLVKPSNAIMLTGIYNDRIIYRVTSGSLTNQLTFGTGKTYSSYGSGSTNNDNVIIPYKILGFKA